MSSSDPRHVAVRGAVLGPDALAAFGLAGAGAAASGAWLPGDLADAGVPSAAPRAALDAFAAFDAFDAEPVSVATPWSGGVDAADGAFADALPDFLCVEDDEVTAGLSPELTLVRERALRDDLARDYEAQLAAMAARHEAELQEAYAAGHAAGQADGAAQAEQLLANAMTVLEEARAQLVAHEDRWLAHLQENVAVLAVGVARHVIGREIAGDDTLVRTRVAAAVAEFPLHEPLTLRVHPDDLSLLKMAFELERGGDLREPRWIADDRVARGGCLVEGRERIVDGRVDTALERVYRQLSGQHA